MTPSLLMNHRVLTPALNCAPVCLRRTLPRMPSPSRPGSAPQTSAIEVLPKFNTQHQALCKAGFQDGGASNACWVCNLWRALSCMTDQGCRGACIAAWDSPGRLWEDRAACGRRPGKVGTACGGCAYWLAGSEGHCTMRRGHHVVRTGLQGYPGRQAQRGLQPFCRVRPVQHHRLPRLRGLKRPAHPLGSHLCQLPACRACLSARGRLFLQR